MLDATGKILVHTVSESERGAKLNWLCTNGRQRVLDHWRDEMIVELFERLRAGAELIEVEIKVLRHG